MGTVWLIASGKGGVGKTTITAALGCALADKGKRVCIVDADIGLRDQDTMLGLENRIIYDVIDVSERNCGLTQALVPANGRDNLFLLPAAQFARVKDLNLKRFTNMITRLKAAHDFVLIDCPAGIERGFRTVLKCGVDHALLLTTPDDLCIRNAERAGNLLREKEIDTQVVVNRLQPELIRSGIMYTAQTVAQTLEHPLLGEIPEDPAVYRAILQHHSVMDTDCEAAEAIKRIAARMTGESSALPAYGTQPLPWYKRLFRHKEK